jgi:hypothetical protein
MALTIVLNVVLAIGVIAMVVTPLAWAILTQHRDHLRPMAAPRSAAQPADPQPSGPARRGSQRAYKPVVGQM